MLDGLDSVHLSLINSIAFRKLPERWLQCGDFGVLRVQYCTGYLSRNNKCNKEGIVLERDRRGPYHELLLLVGTYSIWIFFHFGSFFAEKFAWFGSDAQMKYEMILPFREVRWQTKKFTKFFLSSNSYWCHQKFLTLDFFQITVLFQFCKLFRWRAWSSRRNPTDLYRPVLRKVIVQNVVFSWLISRGAQRRQYSNSLGNIPCHWH